jgi:phage shock protein A
LFRAADANDKGRADLAVFLTTSDRRLKNVGKAFKAGLDEIKKLEVFHYTFKKDPDKTPRVGVMAQDLQKIFPDAVFKGEDGFLRIRMEDMFYAVVNAIKELADKVVAHDKRIEELAKQNEELISKINKLEARVKELEK